jgi:DNA invertase Pin-like site-specific DNA recombinase
MNAPTERQAARPKAYSYLRFSSPEQAAGDSFRRQSEKAAAYAAAHGLDLDTELTFQDLGISAFRGKNVDEGALGMFLAAVRAGAIAPNAFLLVENLDRISRQTARRAANVLGDIVEAGVTLVTLNDARTYTREVLDTDPFAFIYVVLGFMRANAESERKSQLLRDTWQAKRRKAAERPMTKVAPAWLALNTATRKFDIIEDRAAVVRRMFQMAIQGHGLEAIARTLNREGVPTWPTLTNKVRRPFLAACLHHEGDRQSCGGRGFRPAHV